MRLSFIISILFISINLKAQIVGINNISDKTKINETGKISSEKNEKHSILIQLEELRNLISNEDNREKKASYYFDSGVLKYKLDEYRDAIDFFSKSLDLMTFSKVYFNRALSYYQLAEYDKAIADFNSHLKLLENYDDLGEMKIIYKIKADCFIEKMEYENAATEFSNFLEIDDSDIEILYKRGVAYSGLEKYKESIYDFSKILNIKSTITKLQKAYAFKERGEAKSKLQDSYGAIEDLNNAILLAPLFKDSYNVRGNIYFGKKNYNFALKDYNKVLGIDNNDLDALVNRAKIKLILKDKKGGCIDLSRAGELGSDEAYDLIKEHCN